MVPETRAEPPRQPRQARAKQRVEQILAAASQLVMAKGFAGLKMGESASQAGVTPSSIYQYFPNKRAILLELAQRHLDAGQQLLASLLAPEIEDIDDLGQRLDAGIETYYLRLRADPLVPHLRTAFAADTQLREMEAADTVEIEDRLFEATKHLFRPKCQAQIRLAMRMILEFIDVGVDMATALDEREGRAVMDLLYTNLDACWEASVLPHARPSR